MYIHNDQKSEKTNGAKSRQSKPGPESNGGAFQLVDNRSESLAQRELQSSINNAPQTRQLKSWQDLADKSSESKSADSESQSASSPRALNMQNGIFQLQDKPEVTGDSKDSLKLYNLVNSLFKAAPAGGAAIGDGSALAACAHEFNGGDKIGGADHQEKCRQILSGVNKLIRRARNRKVIRAGSQLSAEDYDIAVALMTDLDAALDGTYEQDEE